jgi:hypothetical protein
VFCNFKEGQKAKLNVHINSNVGIFIDDGHVRVQFARTAVFVRLVKGEDGSIQVLPVLHPVHDASYLCDDMGYDMIQLSIAGLSFKFGITMDDLGGLWHFLQQVVDLPAAFKAKVHILTYPHL